jgi:glycine cleavage system H lipoate-binding protein
VGLDAFAASLVGRPDSLHLPSLGERIGAGSPGWSLRFGSKEIPMLSPVAGEVVEINPQIPSDPGLCVDDPYGDGWLFELEVSDRRSALAPLLSGTAARDWTDRCVGSLQRRISPALGTVLQDGGLPISGIARAVDPEGWEHLATEFLLTEVESAQPS